MKRFALFFLALFFSIQSVYADLLEDSNKLFDWAEQEYAQYFSPAGQETLFWDIWRYRYYPDTQNYVGVNDSGDVYILGPISSNAIQKVDTLSNLLTQAFPDSGGTGGCVDLPIIAAGSKYDYKITSPDSNEELTSSIEHLESTQTYSKSQIIASGVTTINESFYRLDGNYSYLSKAQQTVSNVAGDVITVETMEPEEKFFYKQVCVNNSIEQKYTRNVEVTFMGAPLSSEEQEVNKTETVEAVNETVTTEAGTFTTVRIRTVTTETSVTSEEETTSSISWYDINTGVVVKAQSYDYYDRLSGVTEITSLTTP